MSHGFAESAVLHRLSDLNIRNLYGTKYYKTSSDGANSITSDASKYGFTSFEQSGCLADWSLPSSLTLTNTGIKTIVNDEGILIPPPQGEESFILNLFVNLKNFAFAGLGTPPVGVERCSNRGGNFVCLQAPSPFPYPGETTPTVEPYRVNFSSRTKAGGTQGDLSMLVDSSDNVIGVYLRSYFDGALEGGIGCGSYRVSINRGASDGQAPAKGSLSAV